MKTRYDGLKKGCLLQGVCVAMGLLTLGSRESRGDFVFTVNLTEAIFTNASGGTVEDIDGLGTSRVVTGDPSDGGSRTVLDFEPFTGVTVSPEDFLAKKPFRIGFLEIRNGSSRTGSTATGIDLLMLFDVSFVDTENSVTGGRFFQTERRSISLTLTPNTGTPDQNADRYSVDGFPSQAVVLEGKGRPFFISAIVEPPGILPASIDFGGVQSASISGLQAEDPPFRIRLVDFEGEPDENGFLETAAVPEPASVVMLGTGVVGMLIYGRRRKAKASQSRA